MKENVKEKIGIITINDNNNYGNRLQNYALQETIRKLNFEVVSLKNVPTLNEKNKFFLRIIKFVKDSCFNVCKKKTERNKCFESFNKNINISKGYVTPYSIGLNKRYKAFFVGSDQVWNMKFNRMRDVDLLCFAEKSKRNSYAASFGVSEISDKYFSIIEKELKQFNSISVREDKGSEILKKITERDDVEVLVDPTMLLTAEEWDKVANKPLQLDDLEGKKYILNYFLGELSEKRKEEIEKIAKENDCEIINILDSKSPFYQTGPSEFLYLEKNAFLICTDSFHSSVFAILYNKPFIVFNREDNVVNMNSRIETLINKFKLENREFVGKITNENLECDYTLAYKLLKEEREKANSFLKKSLNI